MIVCYYCDKLCSEYHHYARYWECKKCKVVFLIDFTTNKIEVEKFIINGIFTLIVDYKKNCIKIYHSEKITIIPNSDFNITPDNLQDKIKILYTFI